MLEIPRTCASPYAGGLPSNRAPGVCAAEVPTAVKARIHQWDGMLIREWELSASAPGRPATVEFEPGYAARGRRLLRRFAAMQGPGRCRRACASRSASPPRWRSATGSSRPRPGPIPRRLRALLPGRSCEGSAPRSRTTTSPSSGTCARREVLAWEGYFPNRPESYKEDITGMLARLGDAGPQPVELGYHLLLRDAQRRAPRHADRPRKRGRDRARHPHRARAVA